MKAHRLLGGMRRPEPQPYFSVVRLAGVDGGRGAQSLTASGGLTTPLPRDRYVRDNGKIARRIAQDGELVHVLVMGRHRMADAVGLI